MFSTTTITAALLLTSSTVNAIPIWSRLSAALAARQNQDGNATTPIQVAQGSNFFFDSLRLDDACTTGQIGCISSQLATCSPESNWEITPCTSNTTCLAVPALDNTGIFVGCLLFQDAQALLAGGNVSVDFGITSPPNNTESQPADEVPIQTETGSASATDDPTDSSSDPAPTDDPTSTDDSSDPAPTDDPTDSSSDSSDPTSTDDSSDPAPTDTSDPTDPTDSSTDSPVDPTDTSTDTPVDPSATCTDDAPEPESTEYETITVVIQPNPTLTGQMTTVTLSPSDSPSPTDTNSTDPTPTDTDSPSPDVTGTDGAVPTSIPEPDATDPAPTGNSTCTEDPSATEDPTDSDSATDPAPTPTDSISTTDSSNSTTTQQTGLTMTIPPNFSLPTPAATAPPTDTDTPTAPTTTTDTDTPANNVAPAPSATGSSTPDVSVVGTHLIPASSSPARMVRVRRSWD